MSFGKNILIVSKGTNSKGQMAEAYFTHYTQSGTFTNVSLDEKELHPVSIQVMAEDNIDLTQFQPKSIETIKGQKFDYIITLGTEAKALKQDIKAAQELDIKLPELQNPTLEEPELIQSFREIRDLIKKDILKFIGKNLLKTADPDQWLTT
jgi:arsenate reductase (thioredoxin)